MIGSELKPIGFKKKGNLWFIESSDCFSVLELDKSTWGDQFSILLDVVDKKLNKNIEIPKSTDGSFSAWGLEELLVSKEGFKKNLDLEQDTITTDERKKGNIRSIKMGFGIPFLLEINTVEGLKKTLIKNKRLRYHAILPVWNYLNLNIEKEPVLEDQNEETEEDVKARNPFIIGTMSLKDWEEEEEEEERQKKKK
ncbi:MAG: DUF4304 domain-containing protein [Bacteroidales bacterium]|nr:DUF4304 domain-containing protein [Bacteroidales bacterium]